MVLASGIIKCFSYLLIACLVTLAPMREDSSSWDKPAMARAARNLSPKVISAR